MADPKKKDDYPVSFSWHERGGRKSDDEFDPRRDPERPDDWVFPKKPAGLSPEVLRKVIEMLQRQAKKPEGLESGAVEPVYPLETMALGAGGGAAGKELVKLAARKMIERMMRGTGQGPGMQALEGSGRYSPIPRNHPMAAMDRAMGTHSRGPGATLRYRPAGNNRPDPQTIIEGLRRIRASRQSSRMEPFRGPTTEADYPAPFLPRQEGVSHPWVPTTPPRKPIRLGPDLWHD